MVKIIDSRDEPGELSVYDDRNQLVAHVQGGILYGIDIDGYSVEIGRIDHQSEIEGKLKTWQSQR